jgi:hypothetical protein
MFRRLTASFVSIGLLWAILAGPAAAQELDLEPIGIGGRVEVPEAGYALTFPDDWVYVFPSAADAPALIDLAVEAVPDLAGTLEGVLEQDLQFSLMAFGRSNPDAGFTENCNVIDTPGRGLTLNQGLDAEATAFRQLGDQLVSGPDVETLELPAGEAGRIDYGLRFPGYQTEHATYHLTDGSDFHVLTCTYVERPDDDWLSIAETFEFLPDDD